MATNQAAGDVEKSAETRSEAESFVYCKGCGTRLESRARLSKPRAVVDTMMCEDCVEKHGHRLMPKPGAPTFCYRCGTAEEVFEAAGTSPTIYHVCPQCLPDRAARYRTGDFETPPPPPPEEAAAEQTTKPKS